MLILKLLMGKKTVSYLSEGASVNKTNSLWADFGKQNWRCGMNQTPRKRVETKV